MGDDLLRIYFDPKEIDTDSGYPWPWRVAGWYGDNGPRIPDYVRSQAGHRCVRCHHPFVVGETPGHWSPCDEQCTHGGPIRVRYKDGGDDWEPTLLDRPTTWLDEGMINVEVVEAEWRVLTVHHLNGQKQDCRWWNLVPLCQRDHLYIQAKVHMQRRWTKEHSPWFKPYAAGFYASSILGIELGRHEVEARLEELLALEDRQMGLEI